MPIFQTRIILCILVYLLFFVTLCHLWLTLTSQKTTQISLQSCCHTGIINSFWRCRKSCISRTPLLPCYKIILNLCLPGKVLQLLLADLTAGIISLFPMLSYEVLIEKPCRTTPYHPTTLSAPFQVQLSNQAHRHFRFSPTPYFLHLLLTLLSYRRVKIQLAPLLPTSQCLMREKLPCFTAEGSTQVYFSMVYLFLISGKAPISTVHELGLCVATVTAKYHKMSLCP